MQKRLTTEIIKGGVWYKGFPYRARPEVAIYYRLFKDSWPSDPLTGPVLCGHFIYEFDRDAKSYTHGTYRGYMWELDLFLLNVDEAEIAEMRWRGKYSRMP